MKKPLAGVIDYGMGNLHSVGKALALQGAAVKISDRPEALEKADLLVLPGVGSFGAAMKALRKKGMDRFARDWIRRDRPYLGICLGYQMLFEESEEDPGVRGLGVFKGRVVRFRERPGLKVPHMGWNEVSRKTAADPLFRGIKPADLFYFVHSFYPEPTDRSLVCTTTRYGRAFCSAVRRGSLFASQYHPEKSGAVGLRLLKNLIGSLKPGRS